MVDKNLIAAEVEKTKRQYLFLNTGEYFLAGFFWLFAMIVSPHLKPDEKSLSLFSSLFVLFISNGLWEILTGWYADKFRRRFSITAGFFWYGAGVIVMITAVHVGSKDQGSLPLWLTGITLWSLGPAMLSGAKEAWLVDRTCFYDPISKDKLEEIFTKAATLGVVFKSIGAAYAVLALGLTGLLGSAAADHLRPGAMISAGPLALAALILSVRSAALKEEYWTRPDFQTQESLLSFLMTAFRQVVRIPYLWFTLGFVGITSLNYILSSTLGPYISSGNSDVRIVRLLATVIALEVIAGLVGRQLPQWLGHHDRAKVWIPSLAALHLIPLAFTSFSFEICLLAAAFLFRCLQGLIMGSLADTGHRAISDDSHRAIVYSTSSALAAFLLAIPCLLLINDGGANGTIVQKHIEVFWFTMVPVAVLLLAGGSHLVSRQSSADPST